MSVVIVGGHDRMVRQYKEICEDHQWKAKVFTQMRTGLDKQIGCPDLLILFTSTVSHKMIRSVLDGIDEAPATPAVRAPLQRSWRITAFKEGGETHERGSFSHYDANGSGGG